MPAGSGEVWERRRPRRLFSEMPTRTSALPGSLPGSLPEGSEGRGWIEDSGTGGGAEPVEEHARSGGDGLRVLDGIASGNLPPIRAVVEDLLPDSIEMELNLVGAGGSGTRDPAQQGMKAEI